jgi:hypothetical protein
MKSFPPNKLASDYAYMNIPAERAPDPQQSSPAAATTTV